jgi:putative PIN family toxin of toxin-antitoxin system
MPVAVIDLTEMVRLAMQRPEQSPLFQAWENHTFTWVTSEQILAEFIEVINRPRLQHRVRPLVRDALIEALRVRSLFVTPAAEFPHCRDSKDDVIIATAVAAQADFIITTDSDLLDDDTLRQELGNYGIRVVLPVEFLDLLSRNS